jgi:hypothetical protein
VDKIHISTVKRSFSGMPTGNPQAAIMSTAEQAVSKILALAGGI